MNDDKNQFKTEWTIETVAEFLNVINALGHDQAKWGVGRHAESRFAYRGLSHKDHHKLIPGVFRTIKGETKAKYGADERIILDRFIQEAIVFDNRFDSKDYFHWMQIAQHYGVPTRLLDWTDNALVSLYFACASNYSEDGVVWVLHKRRYTEIVNTNNVSVGDIEKMISALFKGGELDADNDYPLLFSPYYFDKRMTAQSSLFMMWANRRDYLENLLKDYRMKLPVQPIETILDRQIMTSELFTTSNDCLFPIIIKSEAKESINEELSRIGVNEKSLFPGLEGVGKFIQRRYDEEDR